MPSKDSHLFNHDITYINKYKVNNRDGNMKNKNISKSLLINNNIKYNDIKYINQMKKLKPIR